MLRVETIALAREISATAADKKAENVVLLDLRQMAGIADYFVIANGGVGRQVDGIADAIREAVRELDPERNVRSEGSAQHGWLLLDYGDLVVHLFTPSRRAYYDLDRLWAKASVLLRME
jgi:ribosome-associated protein